MANKVKFAIVGCGHIGKRHAELVAKHADAQLVATVDPAYDKLELAMVECDHFKNLDDFFKQKIEVDVLNICTPNGMHAEQAIQCLNQGCHVVIEKPIALKIEDANAILVASNKNNKHVFPVVQNRYSSTVKWLKRLVEENVLGDIYMVQLNCFWNRDEHYYSKGSWHGTLVLDGGPLYTQFSHFLDVLLWTFGDITNIKTKFANFSHQRNTEFEDSGIVTFELLNGGMGSINYSTSIFQSNFESSITVIAEKGTVKIGGQYMNSLEYCQIMGIEYPVLKEHAIVNDYGSYKGSASNHHLVIDNVVNVLNGLAKPNVFLQEGFNVVEIISDIYQSRNIKKLY